MSFDNPYKKVEELKKKLIPLEAEEKVLKQGGKVNNKKLKEVENDIFWIVLELIPIESCIKYFENKIKKEVNKK